MIRTPQPLSPLSAAQHGIWLGQQLDRTSPVYNAGECLEIQGPLVPELFEAAVRQTVHEAEALHSRFVPDGEGVGQCFEPQAEWAMHVADLSASPDPWAAARAWMQEDLTRPVDLSQGPLFAQALFKAAPDRFFWYQRIHHIAMDGFGFSLLARRVADLYTERVTGRPATNRFGSMSAVLQEDLAYQAGRQAPLDRDFWMRRLEDRPTPVSLASPAPMSSRFVRQTRHLSAPVFESLQATARQAELSWPDLVLAATAAWLHRQTGASEVILGLPVMSRLGSAALRVPCMAMNIVPLRISVRPEAGLLALARDVAAELRAARPHLRYRYEQLRRDLRMVGGQRRLFGPVVNIMPFDYALKFAGAPSIAHNLSAGPVEDLSIGLYARSDGSGPRVNFDANPACYRPEVLDAHQQDFLSVLESWLAAPAMPVSSLPGRAGATGPSPSVLEGGALPTPVLPVLEQFSARVREQPDAIALEQGSRRMSYRELLQAAWALARQLAAAGARPDVPVAVSVPRCLEAIVAKLGILLSGAGYLPLDPSGPASRATAILEDARPPVLVTLSPETGALHVASTGLTTAPSASRTEEEGLAYVIYTSGSTGQPNGVQVSRGALAHFVSGATHVYGIRREDRVLQFAPLHFDASVEEIFLTLCAGARLVLRTEEMLQSMPTLLEACAEHGITVLDLPTAFWHELAYSVSTGAVRLPACLRTVIIGGEAALPERVSRWNAAVGSGVRLLNTYGPTEATVVATAADLATVGQGAEVPIGQPLPGVRAVLLDPRGQLTAPGAEGELYLLGGGLARGYLGRPELEAARFVTLAQVAGQPRAYRTGDKARVREDGQLVFVGRVDDEFKISGHRIDPAEVETALLGLPGVREAAVVGQVLPGGARRLCAHLVCEAPAPSAAELRRALLGKLPAALVPGTFFFSERLPRTRTGKVDRAELRQLALAAPSAPEASSATGLERQVLRVWEQVLGATALSAQDDFFELGGQSLQAIQVANRLGVELGREVSVATVFRYPTAAALAQALEQGAETTARTGGLTEAMLADAELSEDIVPLRGLPAMSGVQAPLRQVLLTGATGFVGVYLLDQLLRQTHARVVCPVRARDEAHAMERILAALTAQKLPTEGVRERVLALPADLTQPLLGLGSTRFHGLAAECDAIFHNAAVVSVVREYGSLRAANVGGTRELIRLAATVRPKPLHYVSTLAVAPPSNLAPEVPEDFVPPHAGLRDGYQQSKWIAERLVQQAAERGLPATVYRLGRVVGASTSAIVNTQDMVWRILLAGIPVGALPALDVGEIWTPVDYVARALVRLALVPRHGGVFNLAPVPEVRLPELFGWVSAQGYRVEQVSVPEWRARVAAGPGQPEDTSTLAFFELNSGASEPTFGQGPIRHERLTEALADSGITCPPADPQLLARSLEHCVAHGLLPAPSFRPHL